MHYRKPPPHPAGRRRSQQCLSLLILAGMACGSMHALPRAGTCSAAAAPSCETEATSQYLSSIGAPTLRLREADAASEFTSHIAPGIALPNGGPAAAIRVDASTAPASEFHHAPALPQTRTSPCIAQPAPPTNPPDDICLPARSDDFLPPLQSPSGSVQPGGVNIFVLVPRDPTASAMLPLSSATYSQTPK
jgi:hypothetical protein